MVSFTCCSNANPSSGGNFYLAKYGILVEQGSNTCVAWRTKDEHGTTMADPVDTRQNYGVSFNISGRLNEALQNLERGKVERGLDVMKEEDDVEDEEGDEE
jgi:hypothetical protein